MVLISITYLIFLIPEMCFVIIAHGNTMRKNTVEQNDIGINDLLNIVRIYFEYLGKEKCSLILIILLGFLFSFYTKTYVF